MRTLFDQGPEYLEKKTLKFVEAMEIDPWEDLYEDNNDWYSVFVTRVRRKFETCFPWCKCLESALRIKLGWQKASK